MQQYFSVIKSYLLEDVIRRGRMHDEDENHKCDAIFGHAAYNTILQYTGQAFTGRSIRVWLCADRTDKHAEYSFQCK